MKTSELGALKSLIACSRISSGVEPSMRLQGVEAQCQAWGGGVENLQAPRHAKCCSMQAAGTPTGQGAGGGGAVSNIVGIEAVANEQQPQVFKLLCHANGRHAGRTERRVDGQS